MASLQILYRTINLTTTAQVKFLVHVKSSRSSVFSLGMDVLKGDFEKWNVSIYENVTLKKHLVNFRNFLEFLFHCLTSLMVKKKFLISILNLHWYSFLSLPHILLLSVTREKRSEL